MTKAESVLARPRHQYINHLRSHVGSCRKGSGGDWLAMGGTHLILSRIYPLATLEAFCRSLELWVMAGEA
jgi:hypothetical protein